MDTARTEDAKFLAVCGAFYIIKMHVFQNVCLLGKQTNHWTENSWLCTDTGVNIQWCCYSTFRGCLWGVLPQKIVCFPKKKLDPILTIIIMSKRKNFVTKRKVFGNSQCNQEYYTLHWVNDRNTEARQTYKPLVRWSENSWPFARTLEYKLYM